MIIWVVFNDFFYEFYIFFSMESTLCLLYLSILPMFLQRYHKITLLIVCSSIIFILTICRNLLDTCQNRRHAFWNITIYRIQTVAHHTFLTNAQRSLPERFLSSWMSCKSMVLSSILLVILINKFCFQVIKIQYLLLLIVEIQFYHSVSLYLFFSLFVIRRYI